MLAWLVAGLLLVVLLAQRSSMVSSRASAQFRRQVRNGHRTAVMRLAVGNLLMQKLKLYQ